VGRIAAIPVLSIAAVMVAGLIPQGVSAQRQRLRSPWDGLQITPGDAPCSCPAPPAFASTISAEGYYTDKQYSIIDPQKLAAFNEASAGPTHLGQFTTRAADEYRSQGSRAAANCVYSLLTAAAAADAWDGKMPGNNGVYLQNWMLSATAIAYLKVRNSGAGTAQEDAAIQEWFRRVAARVHEYFEDQTARPGSDAWNNHMDWAGLALAAQGVADNDAEALLWGIAAYRLGIDAIQPDGSLPAEMARGQMALHYQLYALGALVMLAELGEANGVPMYAQREGAIHRLVRFDVAAMRDPGIIAKRTGVAQNIARTYSGLEIGWALPYVRRFPNPELSALIAQSSWPNFWQWGGAPPAVGDASVDPTTAATAFLRSSSQRLNQELAAAFPPPSAGSPLIGAWCVQGDPSARASIRIEQDAFALTNENGANALAESPKPSLLLTPAWLGVQGDLSPDQTQIDWNNGTYWMRCTARPLAKLPRLTGAWIAMGERNKPCSIQAHGHDLLLDNGLGATGTGHIDDHGQIVSNWNGHRILGQLTADGNHIHWDNRTYWTRATVYVPSTSE